MSTLLEAAKRTGQQLRKTPSNHLWPIAKLMIGGVDRDFLDPDTIRMWNSLWEAKKATFQQSGIEMPHAEELSFAQWYLEDLHRMAYPPGYMSMTAGDRKKLLSDIQKNGEWLIRTLRDSGLDSHVVYADSGFWKGLSLLENFGDSNRSRILQEAHEHQNVASVSAVLEGAIQYAQTALSEAPRRGKAGTNANAVRLVRELVAFHRTQFGQPLNFVVATAVNRLLGTNYAESDIRNLENR